MSGIFAAIRDVRLLPINNGAIQAGSAELAAQELWRDKPVIFFVTRRPGGSQWLYSCTAIAAIHNEINIFFI